MLIRSRLERRYIALVNTDPARQPSALDVVLCGLDQTRVRLVTSNPQRRSGHARVGTRLGFGVQAIPQSRHMAEPGTEPPALTAKIRGDVRRYHRAFDQEGADATHWVGQSAASSSDARPTRTDQYGRCKVLLERSRTLLKTVATLVQAMPRQVQGQHCLPSIKTQVDAQVRVQLVDTGSLAACGAEPIDNGILDLQSAKVSVVDPGAMAAELNRQTTRCCKMLRPVDLMHSLVEGFGIHGGKTLDHQQHPVRQPRPQTQPVGDLHAGKAANRGGLLTRLLEPELLGFFEQQALEPFWAGEDKFVAISHGMSSQFVRSG